jgi:pSer/pThr/pTyr-binding forkhead associated (FHA) protein
LDLATFLRPLIIAHLFGMGLGSAVAFALAENIYRPAWMKGTGGSIEGRTYPIPAPIAGIGMAEGMPIRLPGDGTVAPFHARIELVGERHLLTAAEGVVRVNGGNVTSHWLQDQDRVEIGSMRLQYRTRLATSGGKVTPIELPKSAPVIPQPRLIDPFGNEHALAEGKFVIGRDESANLAITWEPTVSRRHAEVTVGADSVTVMDLGSSNGTTVNGEPISGPHTLCDGDEIRLGKCSMRYRA